MSWEFTCPICNKPTKTLKAVKDVSKLKESLFLCPCCLEVLKINDDLSVSDFRQILIDNKKKRKLESKLNDAETVNVIDIF